MQAWERQTFQPAPAPSPVASCACALLLLVPPALQATIGEVTIDPAAVVTKQQIQLANAPVGTAHVVFDSTDFGHFLVHPSMTEAVQAAVEVGMLAQRAGSGTPTLASMQCYCTVYVSVGSETPHNQHNAARAEQQMHHACPELFWRRAAVYLWAMALQLAWLLQNIF